MGAYQQNFTCREVLNSNIFRFVLCIADLTSQKKKIASSNGYSPYSSSANFNATVGFVILSSQSTLLHLERHLIGISFGCLVQMGNFRGKIYPEVQEVMFFYHLQTYQTSKPPPGVLPSSCQSAIFYLLKSDRQNFFRSIRDRLVLIYKKLQTVFFPKLTVEFIPNTHLIKFRFRETSQFSFLSMCFFRRQPDS